MPEALAFDAYGTLFDVHSVEERCETLWTGRGAELSRLWRAKQLEYTWQRSLMRRYVPFAEVTREALGYACEALGLALAEPQAAALMDEYLHLALYPDVRAALAQLRAAVRKLAILSNGSPGMLDPLVRNSGLAFDAVLSVHPARTFKPAPEVYQIAVDALGVPAAQIGFVSSNCWDAIGARSFGFKTYWINRAGAPVDRMGFAPDALLGGLGELPGRLA